jgi:hypothetical protein
MRTEALFLNGMFEGVLEEILKIQSHLPDHVMFLQPYSSRAIKSLRENPPSADDPMLMLMSTTEKLDKVAYAAEIVGWEDKTQLANDRWRVINRIIVTLQPNESGLYDGSATGKSLNLLHIRRLRALPRRFGVSRLLNIGDGNPLSDNRSTSGGWIYVNSEQAQRLLQ